MSTWAHVETLLAAGQLGPAATLAGALLREKVALPPGPLLELARRATLAIGSRRAAAELLAEPPPAQVQKDAWRLLRVAATFPVERGGAAHELVVQRLALADPKDLALALRRATAQQPAEAARLSEWLRSQPGLGDLALLLDDDLKASRMPRPLIGALGGLVGLATVLLFTVGPGSTGPVAPEPGPSRVAPRIADAWPAADELCRHRGGSKACDAAVKVQRALNADDCTGAAVAFAALENEVAGLLLDEREADAVDRLRRRLSDECA